MHSNEGLMSLFRATCGVLWLAPVIQQMLLSDWLKEIIIREKTRINVYSGVWIYTQWHVLSNEMKKLVQSREREKPRIY